MSEPLVLSKRELDIEENYEDIKSRMTMDYVDDKEAIEEVARLKNREAYAKINAEWAATCRAAGVKLGCLTEDGKNTGKGNFAELWAIEDAAYELLSKKEKELDAEYWTTTRKEHEVRRLQFLESLAELDTRREGISCRRWVEQKKLDVAQRKVYEARAKLNMRLSAEIVYSPALFTKVFGDPDNKQLVEKNYYFYYKCKDGMVQMVLPCSGFELNVVRIDSVNVY